MISINGNRLTHADKNVIKTFCHYVLSKFVSERRIDKTKIVIKFVTERSLARRKEREELRKYEAWMNYYYLSKRYVITINANTIGKSRSQKVRLKNALECIGHELIHVKQYVTGEMSDYSNGDVKWYGNRYTDWEREEVYFFTPWEIEAYGYEAGLYQRFKAEMM